MIHFLFLFHFVPRHYLRLHILALRIAMDRRKSSPEEISSSEAFTVNLLCGFGLALSFWISNTVYSVNLVTDPSLTLFLISVTYLPSLSIFFYSISQLLCFNSPPSSSSFRLLSFQSSSFSTVAIDTIPNNLR